MTTATREINKYYAALLPLQYKGRPKARATIEAAVSPIVMHQTSYQEISFDAVPDAGYIFVKTDQASMTAVAINWNSNTATITVALKLLPGYSNIQVKGSPAEKSVKIWLYGLEPLAPLIVIDENTLTAGGDPVGVVVEELNETLPLSVQNGFDVRPGSQTAVGKQLDVLGKYVGANRIGRGFSTFVNLTDDEYLLLIRAAIGRNYAKSSLADIDNFLATFFPDQIFVYDYGNMRLGYFISPGTLSSNLLQTFIGQGLLPKPMGVKIAPIIYSLSDELLFGFNSYSKVNQFASGFNSYSDYSSNVTWLTYGYVITL